MRQAQTMGKWCVQVARVQQSGIDTEKFTRAYGSDDAVALCSTK